MRELADHALCHGGAAARHSPADDPTTHSDAWGVRHICLSWIAWLTRHPRLTRHTRHTRHTGTPTHPAHMAH